LLHTPLKRARLPITPPELIFSKTYFLGAGLLAAALLAFAAGLFAEPAEFETEAFAGTLSAACAFASRFAIRSVAGVSISAPFEFEVVAVFAFEFDSVPAGVSGLLPRTDTLPVIAGIDRNNADSMNTVAAVIVTFERTVAVPRGANAELDTLLVNSAPASVLPGCKSTAAISTRHERKNIT